MLMKLIKTTVLRFLIWMEQGLEIISRKENLYIYLKSQSKYSNQYAQLVGGLVFASSGVVQVSCLVRRTVPHSSW